MKSSSRLYGIDFFRCIAIFGVVILHIFTEAYNNPAYNNPLAWLKIREAAKFSVPYFLCASFFLSIKSVRVNHQDFEIWMRLKRILIPYFSWTIVYFIFNLSLSLYRSEFSDFNTKYLHNLTKVFLLGGASFHLWFIPLILAGTGLLKIGEKFFRNSTNRIFNSNSLLSIIFLLSIILYMILDITNNSFNIKSNSAFNSVLAYYFPDSNSSQVLMVSLAYLALAIQCLPCLVFSTLSVNLHSTNQFSRLNKSSTVIFWVLFCLTYVFGNKLLPGSISAILKGCITLWAALIIPINILTRNRLVNSLSNSAYGTYYIHWMIIVTFSFSANKIMAEHFQNLSSLNLVFIAIFNLIASWILIIGLSKVRFFRSIFLGYG